MKGTLSRNRRSHPLGIAKHGAETDHLRYTILCIAVTANVSIPFVSSNPVLWLSQRRSRADSSEHQLWA